MKAAIWAEIRRLHEIEKLSGRAIAGRLAAVANWSSRL